MPWHEWALIALVVVLLATTWGYRDGERIARAWERAWERRYWEMESKHRALLERIRQRAKEGAR